MTYDWKSISIASTPWRITVVADIVPILIRRAKEGRPITYTELSEELFTEFKHPPIGMKVVYGPPVGAVGLAIQEIGKRWGKSIPPINTIVVADATGLPGVGADEIAHYFFKDKGRGMAQERESYLRAAMDAVYAYGNQWDKVGAALGAPILSPVGGAPGPGGVLPLPKLPRKYGGESVEHKAIKDWICANPEVLSDFGKFKFGEIEYPLSSGDSLDAHFDNGKRRLAVEVKASHAPDAELERGVYQCIKYRAVVRAEQIATLAVPNGDAVLVSTRKPTSKILSLLDRLHVEFVQLPMKAEKV